MATLGLIEYKDASPEVRAVYDDIMATRKTDWINNFWKAIAHDPATLKRTWEDIKQIMGSRRARSPDQGVGLSGGERQQSVWVLHRVPHRRGEEQRHDRCDIQGIDGRGGHGERNQSPGRGISGCDR